MRITRHNLSSCSSRAQATLPTPFGVTAFCRRVGTLLVHLGSACLLLFRYLDHSPPTPPHLRAARQTNMPPSVPRSAACMSPPSLLRAHYDTNMPLTEVYKRQVPSTSYTCRAPLYRYHAALPRLPHARLPHACTFHGCVTCARLAPAGTYLRLSAPTPRSLPSLPAARVLHLHAGVCAPLPRGG